MKYKSASLMIAMFLFAWYVWTGNYGMSIVAFWLWHKIRNKNKLQMKS